MAGTRPIQIFSLNILILFLFLLSMAGCNFFHNSGSAQEVEKSSNVVNEVEIGSPDPIFKKTPPNTTAHTRKTSQFPKTENSPKNDSHNSKTHLQENSIASPSATPFPHPSVQEIEYTTTDANLFNQDPVVANFSSDTSDVAHENVPPAFDSYSEEFSKYLMDLKELLDSLNEDKNIDDYSLIKKSELEKKLIALFFLRDQQSPGEYKELLYSLESANSPILVIEILKAALYQELGLVEQRDRVLSKLANYGDGGSTGSSGNFKIKQWNIPTRSNNKTSSPDSQKRYLAPGQEIEVSGEFENFKNLEVSAFGGLANKFRRSFSASLTLYNLRGELLHRSPLLLAGKATELTSDPQKAVRFWGRYRLPAKLAKGPYLLEILAVDLEAKTTTTSQKEFEIQ